MSAAPWAIFFALSKFACARSIVVSRKNHQIFASGGITFG